MSYTFGQTISAFTSATATTITRTITYAAGDRAFVWTAWGNDTSTATVTDTLGNVYTQIGAILSEPASRRMALFSGIITTSGAATVTLTLNATATERGIGIVTYTGLNTSAAQTSSSGNQSGPGTGANAVTTGNMTPTAQPAIVFAVARNNDGGATAAGTGFNDRGSFTTWDTANGEFSRIIDKEVLVTTATAGTFTLTIGTDHVYSFGAVVGEAGGGPLSTATIVWVTA